LAIDRTARRQRQAGADSLTRDVVPERQLVVAFDEQVGHDQLIDGNTRAPRLA
jgi:hypothetical protein